MKLSRLALTLFCFPTLILAGAKNSDPKIAQAWFQTPWPGAGMGQVYVETGALNRIRIRVEGQHELYWFNGAGEIWVDAQHKLELHGRLDPARQSAIFYLTDREKKQGFRLVLTRIAAAKVRRDKLADHVEITVTHPILEDSSPFLQALAKELDQRAAHEWELQSNEAKQALAEGALAGGPTRYESKIELSPHYLDDHIASFVIEDYEYAGGAHGNATTSAITYDFEDGTLRELALDDLFDLEKGYDVLSDAVMNGLRKAGASNVLNNSVTQVTLEQMSRFVVSPQGLTTIFDPYEMGSYAEGAYRVTVPWKQLAGVVKPNSPVQHWIPISTTQPSPH